MNRISLFLLWLLIAAKCAGASVTLSWQPPTNGAVDVTYIVAANANGVSWSIEGVQGTNYVMTGLAPGVRHMFQVFAVNPLGRSGGSNIASFTPSEIIEVEIPKVLSPTNLVGSGVLIGSGTVWTLGLKWTDPNTNAVSFVVSAKDPDGALLQQVKTSAKNAQIPGLAFGSTNAISVTAVDASGNESAPSETGIAIMDRITPIGLRSVEFNFKLLFPKTQ